MQIHDVTNGTRTDGLRGSGQLTEKQKGVLPVTGELMRLVADGLKARGFDVLLPESADDRRVSVGRWGGRCDLVVNDYGIVEWGCRPWASDEPDPGLTADIATFLLAGKADGPSRDGVDQSRGMTFKGIVGSELRARGFDVSLEVYEDNVMLEVLAEILVKNPAVRTDATIHVSDEGEIFWECDYPFEVREITDPSEYLAALENNRVLTDSENNRALTDSIVATVARAVALSSGIDAATGFERRVDLRQTG
jgi:hypothetical protein